MPSYSDNRMFLASRGVDISRIATADYAARLAGGIRRQEAAGLAPSRQAARGHALTEHGKASAFAKSGAAPRYHEVAHAKPSPRERLAKPTRQAVPVPDRTSRQILDWKGRETGRIETLQFHADNGSQGLATIKYIDAVAPGSKVVVTWLDPDGNPRSIGSKGGIKVSTIQELRGSRPLASVIGRIAGEAYGERSEAAYDGGEFWIEVVA